MAAIRVLILEDDQDIVDLIRSVLEPTYECMTAVNGLEGLQKAVQDPPDLVICDIMMPVMDGREFTRSLRKQAGCEQTPVILLSALSSREQIRDGYSLGAALYITKPIDPARFKRNIDLFVQDHHIEPTPRRTSAPASASAPAPDRPLPPKPRPAMFTDRRVVKSSSKPRLLVVDDDRDTCQMVRSALEGDFEILMSSDGISAIEMGVRYKPDIFVIDGMLPRMTGYQLTTMLRKNREFFRSPIIFMSGKATARDQSYVKSLGVQHFLAKPFTVDSLKQILIGIVERDGFQVRTDRMPLGQIYLEQFQRAETHRGEKAVAWDGRERSSSE